MNHVLLTAAQQTHGPPHALILVLPAIGVVAWLVYRVVAGRRRFEKGSPSEQASAMAEPPTDAVEHDQGPKL